jgi:hypothetical protein
MCETSQDQYDYVLQASRTVQILADAILTQSAMPKVPSIDNMCQGIQIATNNHSRVSISSALGLVLQPVWRAGSTPGALSGTMMEPSMMDRMLASVLSDVGDNGPLVHVWPASLHHNLIGPPPPRYSCSTKTASSHKVHLIPVLFHCRWALFRVDPQRSVIDFLDLLASSTGCEMSTFQVGTGSGTVQALRSTVTGSGRVVEFPQYYTSAENVYSQV